MTTQSSPTFNGPLEAGIRLLSVLVPGYPRAFDLQRLVAFDYLIVHSGDIGGPESLHPMLPQREAELLVRRSVVERGVHVMMHSGLVERVLDERGIAYRATELAERVMAALSAPYILGLLNRGTWVVRTFENVDEGELRSSMRRVFGHWIEEFQAAQRSLAFDV